jgi:hypothetical protein
MSGPRRSAPWSAFCLDPGSAHRASHQPICRRNRAPRSRHGARHPLGISLSPKAAGRWPVFSVTLLLRRQAPVWTRLWHEDVRLSHCPIHYVCLCLQDEPSVIAQQARLLLVFHGLLLGHRHRLRPQADQGFRVSAAGLHNPGFRNGFNAAKRGRFAAKPLIWWAIDRSKVRVLVRPPPSPVQIRFPAVSERTPGFPRHSRRPERRFPSLRWERTNRGAKTPPGLWHAQTLSQQILSPRTETRSHVD